MSYRSTVARQPEALKDCLIARTEIEVMDLEPLKSGLVAVTGIGASYAAAVVVAGELQWRGRRAFPIRPVDMMNGGDVADVILALSHRGRSVETVQALYNHPDAAKLAITKDAESPLAEAAGRHLRIENGSDATPSSTGYTGTLLVAGLLLEKLCGPTTTDWDAIPGLAADVLSRSAEKMQRIGKLFEGRRAIDCVGAGSALGTAEGATLLIREAARIPTSPADTRHYLHGPMESMDNTTGVVVFGDEREVQIAQQLQEIGCPVVLVTANPEVADGDILTVLKVPRQESRIARGILDILSAQLLAAELSDAVGLTDTKFRYPQTDTKIKAA